MNIQYFKSAWGDIKNSPGWFGKLCLLALLNFIPIFGQIVTFGYLYGWAREIAWGTHEPMPAQIFGNEDGKQYRRGWFVFVLSFVLALIPDIITRIGNTMQGPNSFALMLNQGAATTTVTVNPAIAGIGALIVCLGWILSLFINIPVWVGGMRLSLYDRLSAGFQLGKIWKMIRHDTNGIMRIFGMYLLVSLIGGFILGIIISILIAIVALVGVSGLMGAGYTISSLQNLSSTEAFVVLMHIIQSAGIVGVIALLLSVFLAFVLGMFTSMLVIRAMGYWTMQFDVAMWRGQDDPMPFELAGAASGSYPGAQYAQQSQPWQAQQTQQQAWQQQPMAGQQPMQQPMQGQQPMQAQQPAQAQPQQPAQSQQAWQQTQPSGQPAAQPPAQESISVPGYDEAASLQVDATSSNGSEVDGVNRPIE